MKSRQIQIQNKMFIQNSQTKYGKYFIPKWLYLYIKHNNVLTWVLCSHSWCITTENTVHLGQKKYLIWYKSFKIKREIKNMAARQSDAIPRSFAHVAGHQSISIE